MSLAPLDLQRFLKLLMTLRKKNKKVVGKKAPAVLVVLTSKDDGHDGDAAKVSGDLSNPLSSENPN